MKPWGKHRLNPVILFCLLLASGCLSGGPPAMFYTLTSTAVDTSLGTGTPSDLAIGIGPVSLPSYLERLPIVTRTGPNRLKIDDGQRWAGPLKEEIVRVVKQNLTALTANPRVRAFPWHRDAAPDLRVRLNVLAFEGRAGKVHLNGQWSLIDKVAGTVVDDRPARIEVPVQGNDTEALVAAMSQALEVLSHEIAAEIIGQTSAR